MPSYQPFPITEHKSGLYTYVQPWIRPIDAFEPLQNAFIYRGQLLKRYGYSFFGAPVYTNNQIIGTGDGSSVYSSTDGSPKGIPLSNFPVQSGSTFTVTVQDSATLETFTGTAASGSATLSGTVNAADKFVINYTTGAWTLTLAGGRTVAANQPIVAKYSYVPTQTTPVVTNPIMGLKVWTNESGTSSILLALTTRRASAYNNTTAVFDPISSVSQVLWVGDGATMGAITFSTGWTNIAPYSVSITDGTTTITDDGVTPIGTLSSGGNFAAGGTVTYASGSVTINLVAPSSATFTITFQLQGDYFTGTTANFFNATNWVDPAAITGGSGSLYLTNNVDRITLYNGSTLSRPPFPITDAHNITYTNDISYCLDLDVYKNRLIVQRPFVVGDTNVSGQSFRWSKQNDPTNLVADVQGNGGEASAPTHDLIQSSEFLRDVIVVPFTNSAWIFRFTNNFFDPFRWDKINSTKSCNAPYATIPYDERITFMGAKGLVACDGVNVQRYDNAVINEFLNINGLYFAQCFGIRFDTTNQSFMTYPAYSPANGNAQSSVSDQILIYNFIENTWATYVLAMSCFGIFNNQTVATWSSFAVGQPNQSSWQEADFSWDYYAKQTQSPQLLGGGYDGIVWRMNDGNRDAFYPTNSSSGTSIPCTILSTRWNPFIALGQKVQFGWVDFYYAVNNDCVLTISFFTDNSENPISPSQSITLSANGTDGTAQSEYAMKRVYINAMGEFIQMQIESSSDASFKINGFILWCRPAGRLTP